MVFSVSCFAIPVEIRNYHASKSFSCSVVVKTEMILVQIQEKKFCSFNLDYIVKVNGVNFWLWNSNYESIVTQQFYKVSVKNEKALK